MAIWYLQAELGVMEQAAAPEQETAELVLTEDAAERYDESAQEMQDLLGIEVEGISLLGCGLFLLSLLVALAVRWIVLRVMDRYFKRVVEGTETSYDNKILAALRRSAGTFIILGGFLLAFSFIRLPAEPIDWQALVWRLLHSLIIISAGFLAYRIIEIALHFIGTKKSREGDSILDRQIIPLIRDVIKVGMIVLVVITLVQSWGYSAAGILTGVGIGGLALAFAAQDTVANIFGSFVIYADRPFKVGDWILIGGVEGTVEEIGIRSTRVRKFDKTIVSVPNKIVTNESIQNYSAMPKRRIKIYVGLSYDASTEQVKAVVEDTRQLLKTHPEIHQEFWMVNFTEMSPSSLDMVVYCFTTTTVWKEYMDVRQDVLLRIIDICARHRVEIAFPSRTIYHRHIEHSPDINLPEGLRGGHDLPQSLSREAATGIPLELARGEMDSSAADSSEGENS